MATGWWHRGDKQAARRARRVRPAALNLEQLEDRNLLTSFSVAGTVTVGTEPGSVVAADFNRDGIRDLAVANILDNTVSILQGNGDGTFTDVADNIVGMHPRGLAVGDFRGTGQSDLAVIEHVGFGDPGFVTILLSNGNGTFRPGVDYAVGHGPEGVAVGDFNGDGKLDLAVANYNDNTVSILLGNGNGTFGTPTTYATGSGPASIAVADFNGDGKADLVIGNRNGNNVSVLLGNGNGTFQGAVNYSAGSQPFSVVAGDFNHDGKPDVAVADRMGGVSVLLGNGNGTFQGAVSYAAGTSPWSIVAADLNGDGNLDLAVANDGSGNVSVLLGNGNGTFAPAVNYDTTGSGPFALAVADLNGDSAPDLAVADRDSNFVSILVSSNDATHFGFNVPSSVTAGQRFNVTVTALSAFNTRATGYLGTAHFVASNGAMANYTFTSADMGRHTFNIALYQANTLTITATDTTNPSITGNFSVTVNPAAPDHIALSIASTITHGVPFSLTITIQDAYNNTVTNYTGTIHVQLTGPVMPMANVVFAASDMGSRTFSNLVLNTTGMYTLTATDLSMPTLTGTTMFTIV